MPAGTLNGSCALELQLFATRIQLQPEADLLLQYTCATEGSMIGISLMLTLEPPAADSNGAAMQHVFTSESGVQDSCERKPVLQQFASLARCAMSKSQAVASNRSTIAHSSVPGVPCALPHAHLPTTTSYCVMESTSNVPSAFWESRTYSIPRYCQETYSITSIGIMCHSLADTGSPQHHTRFDGHLGMIATLPSQSKFLCCAFRQVITSWCLCFPAGKIAISQHAPRLDR